MGNEYSGKELKHSIAVSELLNGQSVAMVQVPYHLNEAEFWHLQQGQPATATLATMIFSGVIGYTVSLGPKIVALLGNGPLPPNDPLQFTGGELATVILGMVIAVVVYFAGGWIFPTQKKRVMKKISQHFETEKPSLHIMVDKQ